MKRTTRTRGPTPWGRRLRAGSALAIAGAATLAACVAFRRWPTWVIAAGAAQLAVAAALLKSALVRWRGVRLERASIGALDFPAGWHCRPNLKLRHGGDVDLYLEAPDGRRYAVEIKSFGSLAVERGFLGLGRPRLVDAHGRALPRDPMGQTLRNAAALGARPVLWLPRARGATVTLGNGLVIVLGSGDGLLRAVGARRWWSLGWWFR